MLVVTDPAADPLLMTAAQMRVAAGLAVDDDSQDASLALLNARISAEIYNACGIAVAEGAEPTLRQETLTETFRCPPDGLLILSRRHNVEVVSIDVDDEALVTDDYEVQGEAGLLYRLYDGRRRCWRGRLVEVVYKAGFATVPPLLVAAATDLIRTRQSEVSRDPLVKSERVRVDGVDETETQFWVNAVASATVAAAVPADVMAKLGRFRNLRIGG